jgi:hypothetical protein
MVDLTLLADEPVPAIALIVGGLLSIVVAAYGHREDSHWDEVGTFIGFMVGAAMFVIAFFAGTESTVEWSTLVLIILLAATLFLKPMRQIPWAGVLGVIVGAAAAVAASFVLPSTILGVDEWVILVVIFFIVGAIVHTVLHFLEDVLAIATMVLDWKPIMVMIGLVAMVEGALLMMDTSIFSFF